MDTVLAAARTVAAGVAAAAGMDTADRPLDTPVVAVAVVDILAGMVDTVAD